MKIFEFKNEDSFEYPDEMKKILDYLNDVGTINPSISKKTIESLYREWSDDCYCAGWMGVNDNLLEEFATWLSEKEI